MAAPTSLKDTRVKRFSPAGTSDSLDATDEFPGACAQLANLIPDLSTKNLWCCRQGANLITDFSTWPIYNAPSGTARPSVCMVVGSVVYGLCNAGSTVDKPFAYDLSTNAFLTVNIGSGAVYPTSQAQGANSPVPTAALIGDVIIITHPGYPLSSTGCKGSLNLSSPLAPTYGTADLSGAITFVALGAIPSWVCQFNQRAYYGVNATQPSVVASDPLIPSSVTNAGQALTFGDSIPLTAAAPLGLSNQLGGIIQSLMVFKGVNNIEQITGDYALSTWAVNTLNVSTGCAYPRAICSTPLGLAFMAPDGVRIIDPNGNVGDPLGVAGTGINAALLFFLQPFPAATPFTCTMACDATTIRVDIYDTDEVGSGDFPLSYWYNIPRKVWSGPHYFSAMQYGLWNGEFVAMLSSYQDLNGGLYYSPSSQNNSFGFTEFGSALSFTMQSAMLEDSGQMAESELVEMQVVAGSSASETLTVKLLDSNGNTINTASPVVVNASGAKPGLYPYRVDFPAISVFNRVAVSISGASGADVRIGDTWIRMRSLGYVISGQTPSS